MVGVYKVWGVNVLYSAAFGIHSTKVGNILYKD